MPKTPTARLRRALSRPFARLGLYRLALIVWGKPCRIAGGDETPEEKTAREAREKAEADKAAADKKAADDKAEADRKAAEAALGDPGKAALDAERTARKAAEKRAKDAEAKAKKFEDDQLSDAEKLKKEAEEGKALAATATDKLRKANLISALADKGLAGAKAKAAARLLDDVEYGNDDEPTNLDDVIKAATAEYGEDMFKGLKPKAPRTNSADKAVDDGDKPKLTAEELQYAASFGMTAEEYEANKAVDVKPEPAKTT